MGYKDNGKSMCVRVDNFLQNGINYKSTNNLYAITATNERFYAGDHWKDIERKNLIPVTLNFLEQLVDVKVATVMANQISIERKADDLDYNDERVLKCASIFKQLDKKNWERLKMDDMNERGLKQGALSGLMVSYWYWNEEIRTGNQFVQQGDIDGELIRAINFYVDNPSCLDIDKQNRIAIAYRMSVESVQNMARKEGLAEDEIEKIRGDSNIAYEGADKAYYEQEQENDNGNITVTLFLERNQDTGTIWASKHIKQLTIKKAYDTKCRRYPVAIMPWKERDAFIYGQSELQFLIANQQHVNVLESLRGLHAKLQAVPITLYNKNVINAYSNQIGSLIPVNGQAGDDLSRAVVHKQPANMGVDVDKSVETVMTLSREFKGINDNVVGASRPDNKSAIIAQQKAAGVPLETIKRRFYQYIEDVALVWEEFYKNYYTEIRKVIMEDDDDIELFGKEVEFTGTDYEDVILSTVIEVGASTNFTSEASISILQELLNAGHITPAQYLERLPKNLIPEQQSLIEELGGGDQQRKFEMMMKFLQELDPESKMAVMDMMQQDIAQQQGTSPLN